MHALVTGASAGLGEAIARELSRRGWDVTLVSRRAEALAAVARELETRTHVVACDLCEPAAVPALIEGAEAALGPIDLLVSNAGFMTLGPVAAFDRREADRLFAVNLLTPMRLVQAVLPGMVARGRGTIVNVTSIAAFVTPPDWVYQSASKTASAVFSEGLSRELAGTGVHVVTAYPGLNDTAMSRDGLASYGKAARLLLRLLPVGLPARFARAVCDAVEARRRRLVYPGFYGLVRWFPRLAQWLVQRVAPRLPA